MISIIPMARAAMSQVWTPRGSTPRGTGRRSVTGAVPAHRMVGHRYRSRCSNVKRALPSAR